LRYVLLLSVLATSFFASMGFIKPAQAEIGPNHQISVKYTAAKVHNDHDTDFIWKNYGEWKFGLRTELESQYTEVPTNYWSVDSGDTVNFPDIAKIWLAGNGTWFRMRAQEYDAIIDVDGQIIEPTWVDYTSEIQIDVEFETVNDWISRSAKQGDVTHYYEYYIENKNPTVTQLICYGALWGMPVYLDGIGLDPEGDSMTCEWTFGDGATSTEWDPDHTYADVGTYTVSFRVKDHFGAYSDFSYATVKVLPYVAIDEAFVSDNRCDIDSLQTVDFHAKWAHNDSDVIGGSVYVNQTEYVTNATGWITFDVTDNTVGENTWTVTGVNASGVIDYKQLVSDPSIIWDKVDVTLLVTDGAIEVTGTASITHTAAYQYDGADFDGTITLNDTLTKSSAGTYYYTTQSISGDTYGITAFESNTVAVTFVDTESPVANAGSDRTVDEDTPVTLDGSSSTDNGDITAYTWTFTDATTKTLTGEKPTYTFNTPGVYTITLNVTDTGGNWATDTVTITVLDVTAPVADAGSDQKVKVDTSVSFDASNSTDNVAIVSYEWDFGDETNGTGKTTTHTYTEPGAYNITLTVKDAAGNSDTDSITVTVEATPIAFPWWILGVVGAVIAAGIVATLLLWRRKAPKGP